MLRHTPLGIQTRPKQILIIKDFDRLHIVYVNTLLFELLIVSNE